MGCQKSVRYIRVWSKVDSCFCEALYKYTMLSRLSRPIKLSNFKRLSRLTRLSKLTSLPRLSTYKASKAYLAKKKAIKDVLG